MYQCILYLLECFNFNSVFSAKNSAPCRLSGSLLLRIPIFLASLFFCSLSIASSSLEDIKTLVKIQVPELALAMINRHQPDVHNDQKKWLRWEKQRFKIYSQLKAYKRLIERTEKYPSDLPDSFYQWATKQSIQAYLNRGDGFGARNIGKKLLWGKYGVLDERLIVELQELIITGYLVEGLSKDAYEAMQFQQKNVGSRKNIINGRAWKLLYAQVLLINGYAEKANKELVKFTGEDVDALKLLIKMQLKNADPDDVIRLAKKAKAKRNKEDSIPYWAIIASASKMKRDYKSQLWSLETVLSSDKRFPLFGNLYSANADSLWKAYLNYAAVVKQRRKLKSKDITLLTTADSLRKEQMFDARSLYADIAINGKNAAIKIKAHKKFVSTLYLNKFGYRVVKHLYLDSKLFPSIDAIPAAVRHMVVGKALKTSDILLASSLIRGMVDVPKGINSLDWQLRRARVHILAGNFQQGMEVLLGIFKDVEKLNNKQVDRLLQVLFDLQASGKHRAVFPLFEIVMKRTQDKKRKREILYWMADSMKVLEEHAEAAHYYLKSAGLTATKNMDLWAQSARFQAGEALAKAGLIIDAKQVLNGLLVVTKDPGRRALLLRQINQLTTTGRL